MFANFVTSALVRYNYHTHINYNHNSNVNDISSEHLFGFENSPTEKDNIVIKKRKKENMFSAWTLLFLTKTLWPGFVEPLSCGDFGSAAAVLVVVAWPAAVFAVGSP